MIWLVVLLVCPVFALLILLFVRTKITFDNNIEESKISIIIAVRDEEDNLPNLFNALDGVNYPKEKLEIWFGNDDSSDRSLQLMEDYSEGKDYVKVVNIHPTEIQEAKANVLMQLCQKATGKFLLFLDADIIPQPNLINNYLSHWKEGYGGVTGVTLPLVNSFTSKMQEIDWCLSLGMGYDAQTMGQNITAMGNNMFVLKEVYERVGGYEALPKSVVEDFTLYKSIRDLGIEFPVLYTPHLLVKTQPIAGLSNLLRQRKRWMKGGMQLAWFMKVALLVQGLYYPLSLALFYFFPLIISSIWGVKTLLQSIYIAKQYKRLELKIPWFGVIKYEIYNCIFTVLLLVYFVLPINVNWKSREYGNR